MKFFGQTKDGVIDNLLRAYVSRPGNPHQACPDFDPDRASAYIERTLTGASRLHYEVHLSECGACRKNVVALVRLAEADTVAPRFPAREVARSAWFSGAKQMFGALSQPQWAMAAAAVIVLAISLPLLLTRNQAREASQAIAENDKSQSATAPASPAANPKSGDVAPSASNLATSKQRENSDEKTEVLARNVPAASKPADALAGIEAGADLSKKSEARGASQSGEEAQRKAEGQLAPTPAQGGAAPGSQVAKKDSDQSRQQQPEKDSSQQASESKAVARADEPSAKKENEGRAEEAAAPPPPASPSEVARSRSGLRRSGKLSLRDSATGEAVRPEERKLSGKKFLFTDGAWTDKDFDPNKDLPVVTIIRDSNVYKEVLSKRTGLKPFLTGFPAAERAIIVYKGTVYKLIPQ
jgi:hypothetical protein